MDLGLGFGPLGAQRERVHARDHLAGLREVAFPLQDLDDAAGNFGGDVDFGRLDAAIAGSDAGRETFGTHDPPEHGDGHDDPDEN